MKRVLAALLAVLLLTCVFATVAMAAPDAPAPSDKDLKKYNYGDWITMVDTTGKTAVLNEGDHEKLDLSDVEKPSNSEIEAYLNARYVADPPKFTVHCVNRFHKQHWDTEEGFCDDCCKGWVKESTSHYACDGGYWKVVKTNGNVVTAQWKCPYLGKHQHHDIYITVTYKAPHTHDFTNEVAEEKYLKTRATCMAPAVYYMSCSRCGESSKGYEDEATFESGDKDFTNHVGDNVYTDNKDDTANQLDGTHKVTCSACEGVKIAEEDHKWNKTGSQEATEEAEGWENYECGDCRAQKQITLPKLEHDHDFGELVQAKDPSCNTPGNIAYYECKTCGQCFAEDDVDYQHPLEKVTIDSLGHDFAGVAFVAENGEHVRICKRANCDKTEGWRDVHDPEWSKWVMEVVGGESTQHMRECQYDYQNNGCTITERENHHMTDWYSISATQHKRNCSDCDYTEVADHHFDNGVDATNENGERGKKYTCTDCGYWYFVANEPVVTGEPTAKPTAKPTEKPTEAPTTAPTEEPTAEPTAEPTEEPTTAPTEEPTAEPTAEPTEEPTAEPSVEPSAEPSVEPSTEPTKKPGGTKIPKTGDNSHFGYAYLMIAVAAAGLCVLAATRRKEGSK